VDPTPDPLLLIKFVSAGYQTRTSGYVARNSDYYTTEAVNTADKHFQINVIFKIIKFPFQEILRLI
jgi:hypothetical protein